MPSPLPSLVNAVAAAESAQCSRRCRVWPVLSPLQSLASALAAAESGQCSRRCRVWPVLSPLLSLVSALSAAESEKKDPDGGRVTTSVVYEGDAGSSLPGANEGNEDGLGFRHDR
ncbi:hypothetical protein NDU88_000073 [Pleurodeles waltl]|uniref:Uncharacterized protein n=1 Tax=Pleurodeles waltl TaxID=8319 RepID=A0AAV7LUU9_PLEWA|nr:hypothetical protein NDU88_000073 [Pleurodeles waltl]